MTTDSDLRIAAVSAAAVITAAQHGCHHEVLETATRLYDWMNVSPPVASLRATAGPVRKQTGKKGNTMQLHDDEEFDLVLDAKDAKGQEVFGDTVTWTVADENVVTVTVSDDTKTATVVAGNVGSTVITFADGTVSGTEAVDVVAGDVATVSVTEGPVRKQTPAAPEAGAPGSADTTTA